MIRKLAAAAAIGLTGALALGGIAHAQDDGHYPDTGWSALDNGADQASASTIHDPTTVWLIEDGTTDTGTSVETTDLDLEVADGTTVSFRYELHDGAECAGGAPRIFVEVDGEYANSWDGHDGQCGDDDGVVSFLLAGGGTIGHAGVVYDSGTEGSVRIDQVFLGDTEILFKEPESTPDPSPSTDPSPTIEPTDDPSEAAGEGGSDDELAQTGMPVVGGTILGVLLLGAGATAMVLGRRRTRLAPLD